MLAFAAEQKAPRAITLRGLFPLFFLPILRIVYFYMGEEWVKR